MSKIHQNYLNEQINYSRTRQLETQLAIELEKEQTQHINLQRQQLASQKASAALQGDRIDLNSAYVTNQIKEITQGKLKDQLSYEMTARELGRLGYQASLASQRISVEAAFEEARHQRAMLYGGSGTPTKPITVSATTIQGTTEKSSGFGIDLGRFFQRK